MLKVIFYRQRLLTNLCKTKIMVFNTTQTWVTIKETKSFSERKRWHAHFPTHTLELHSQDLGSPNERLPVLRFLMEMYPSSNNHKINCRGFRHLQHLPFSMVQKLREPSLHRAHNWVTLETTLISMIGCILLLNTPSYNSDSNHKQCWIQYTG